MAVALVDGTVCRQEVQVLIVLTIPDGATTRAGKDNGKRVIVMSGVGGLVLHGILGRDGVISRWVRSAGGVEGRCSGLERCAVACGRRGIEGGDGDWRHYGERGKKNDGV